MLRRIAVLASLAVVAAMFVGGSTANANDQTGNGGVCIFEGLAGQLTPGIQDIAEDLNDPNPLDIERGTYNFNGDATCVGKVGNTVFAPGLNGAPAQNVSIVSNGNYDNILCGTGFAHDQDGTGTTVTDNTSGAQIAGVGYEIPFIVGNGAILIGTPTNLSGFADGPPATTVFPHDGKYPDHRPHAGVTGSYVGLGAVRITAGDATANPPDTDNCGTDNNDGDNLTDPPNTGATAANDGTTDRFLVAGAFVAVGKPIAH